MREQLWARLKELKKELETGQAQLQQVEMQRTYLHETVLRIGGTVQVLEGLLKEGQSSGQTRAAPNENSVPQFLSEAVSHKVRSGRGFVES